MIFYGRPGICLEKKLIKLLSIKTISRRVLLKVHMSMSLDATLIKHIVMRLQDRNQALSGMDMSI